MRVRCTKCQLAARAAALDAEHVRARRRLECAGQRAGGRGRGPQLAGRAERGRTEELATR